MKYCIFIFVFIFHIYPSWAREPLLTDVVDKDINITASFDGAKIVIYGAIDTKLHKDSILIINILGPSSHLKIRKKEKFWGAWLAGNNEMVFEDAPGYFASASNIDNLDSIDDYKNLLKIFYKNRGLYQTTSNIDVLGETLFRTEFLLPAITPTGTYNVKSFLLSNNGKLISSWNNSVKVSKEGLAEGLYDYSIEHPFLYGLLAALGAILAGYIASEVFRRI
jgi:hypothetical protein